MQNAVSLLKISLALFASFIRKLLLQEIEESNRLLLQLGQLFLWNTKLASIQIPVHALNKYFLNIATGISNIGQAAQTGACFGVID